MITLPSNVIKQIIYAPKFDENNSPTPPYPDGSRLRLHFKIATSSDAKIIDDSRDHPKPLDFLMGKKFKVEAWEAALNTMRVGEVSEFYVPKEHCAFYPMVAKVIRDSHKTAPGNKASSSCCAQAMSGTGYEDLDKLLAAPQDMIFVFDLIEVSLPGEYEMESWHMTDEEKAGSIESLHAEGNRLVSIQDFLGAMQKYGEALTRIDDLTNKEVPGSSEMKALQEKKLPFLMNYAFCKQKTKEYYEGIKYNTQALEIQPNNAKAVFRRGLCNKEVGLWKEAREDFTRAKDLDESLTAAVRSELNFLLQAEKDHKGVEAESYKRMFKGD